MVYRHGCKQQLWVGACPGDSLAQAPSHRDVSRKPLAGDFGPLLKKQDIVTEAAADTNRFTASVGEFLEKAPRKGKSEAKQGKKRRLIRFTLKGLGGKPIGGADILAA